MPDSTTPPIDPVSLALSSKQIKPEDAAYISDKAAKFGVDPATLGYDLAPVREAWADLDSQNGWRKLAQTPGMADWMIKGHNAAVIQDDLYNTIAVRTAFEKSRLPDGASIFELAGPRLMSSVRTVGRGVAWLGAMANPVTGWRETMALVSDDAYEGSITQSLADSAVNADANAAKVQGDITQRMLIGGNRLHVLAGDILGQAPETLMTGYALGALAKSAAKQGVSTFLARAALARGGVGAARITATVRGNALLQGGYEGSRTLIDRVKGNAEAGRDLISGRDVGAALSTASLIFFTELIGGISGEVRSLGSGATTFRAVAKDIVVQPGQEAIQEFGQSIINDIADGKHIDWTEAQWAALGGALGGTMFAAPTMVGAFASKLSVSGRKKAEGALTLAADMSKSAMAVEHAGKLADTVNALAQSKTISRMTRSEHLKMLREAHGVDTETRHFNVADFNALAEKLGTSADALAAQWGAVIESGNVTVPHAELAHELAALKAAGKEDVVAFGLETVRKTADAASLSDSIALIEGMDKRMQALAKDDKPLMPDGVTLDDSAEVAASFEADLVKAGRKESYAKRDAMVAAELVRTAADTFNEQYAAAGSDKRVTPKQLWDATKPSVDAGPATGKGRATYAPSMRSLRITPESDATSVHHEFMHHWIESMRTWEDAPQKIRNDLAELGSFISSRSDTVSKYYNKTTDGAKVTADEVREAAAKLHTKEFDIESPAGAAVHEGITASWEEYLASGKAPTKKLARVFESIAGWFRKVYANVLKADKASLDLTGEKLLSDQTRALFNRWLTAADRVTVSRLTPGGAAKLKVSSEGIALIESVMSETIAKAQGSVAEALKTKAADAIAANETKARAALTETLTEEVSARPEYRAQNAAIEQPLNTEAVTALLNATGRMDLLPALKPFLGGTVEPSLFAAAFDAQDPVQLFQAMAQARPLTDVVADLVESEMGKQSAATVAEQTAADLASSEGSARVAVAEARALRESAKLVKDDGGLTQDDLDGLISLLGLSGSKPEDTAIPAKNDKGWDRISVLADAYKANATAANLAAVKDAIVSEANAGNLDAPNGSPVAHVFETEQGSVYVITKDGQTRRVKSLHSNTGTDHGLHGWSPHGIFMPDASGIRQTGSALRMLATKFDNTILHFDGGKVKAKILDGGVWRDANISDAYPGAVKTGIMKDGPLEFPYTKTPADGAQILEWDTRADGVLKSIHDGSGVASGSVVPVSQTTDPRSANPKRSAARANESAPSASNKLVKAGEKKEKAAVAAKETWRQRAKDKAEQAKLQKDGEKADIARMVAEMRQDLDAAVTDGAAFRIQSESLTPTTAKDKADAAAAKAAKLAAKGDYEGALNAYYDVETYTEAMKQMAKGETSKRRNAVADAAAADYDSLTEVAEWRVSQMPAQLIKPSRMTAIVNASHKRQQTALANGDTDAYVQAKLDEAAAHAMRAALIKAEKKLNDAKNTVAEAGKRSERIELERGGMWMVTAPDGSVQTFASESQAYDAWISGGRDYGGYRMTRADNLTSVRDAIVGILTKRYGGERFRLTEDRPQDRNALRALIWLEESTQRQTATIALAACAADPLKGADALTPAMLDLMKDNNLDPENWTLRDWQEVAYQMETLQALAKETHLVGKQAADDVDGLIAAARASKHPPQKEKAYRTFWDKVADTILKPQETWRTYLQPLGQMGIDVFVRPGNEAQADMQDALDGASKILTPAMNKLPSGMDAVTTVEGLQTTRWEQLSRVLLWGSVTGKQRVMADFAGRYQSMGQPSRGTAFMEATLSSLTDVEVDFLNAYWASFENLWERQTKVARRVGAAIPPPIQATAFETSHGKRLTGGYAKLRYKESAAFAEFSLSSGVSMAAIDESMLHERAPKIDGKPLDLGMDVQHQARRSAAKYIGYKPFAVRMSALFRDDKLKGVISTRFGLEYMKGIEEYINFTINGVKPPETSTLDAVAAGWRRNVSMAIYTANALTAPRQLIGVLPAAGHKDVGVRALMTGMLSVMSNPQAAWNNAKQASQMMRQRFRDPGQDLAAPDRQTGIPSGWDKMHELGTFGMRFFQFLTDVVVFESARLKALGSGKTELEAVRQAESVVTETQSSSSNAEAAKVNRTQMGLLLTMGGKWMISNANMLLRQYRDAKYESGRDAQARFVKSVFLSLIASNAAMMLSAQLLQPKDDGEDKDVTPGDYASKVFLDSVTGTHFALRMFLPAIDAALKGNQGGVASSVAGMAYTPIKEGFFFFNELGRKDTRTEKVISSAVGMGSVFGLPSTQIKRVIKATTEESDNGFETLMKAIFGSEYIPR